MFSYFFTHPHTRQEKRALRGTFFVFGVFFTLSLPLNSQNVPPLGAFWLFGVFLTTPHGDPTHPLQPRLTRTPPPYPS